MADMDELTGTDARQDTGGFRATLGNLPSGVAAITALSDGQPIGVTVASLLMVSVEPPMVGFMLGKSSSSLPRIIEHGSFTANILPAEQQDLAIGFATKPATERFSDVSWRPAPGTGNPVLDGAVAWIDCRITTVVEPGDYALVVGEADRFGTGPEGTPLAFHRGRFTRLTED